MVHPDHGRDRRRRHRAGPRATCLAGADAPEHARRLDGRDARDHRKDRRLAGAGGHLRGAQRRARGFGGFFLLEAGDVAAMAPGTDTGAAHPVADGRRDGRGDEAEGGERRRGVPAQHHRASAGATAHWPRRRCCESKSFTEREALDQHLIDLVAPDERQPAGAARRPHGDALRRHARDPAHRGRGDRGLPADAAAEHHRRHRRSEYRAGAAGARRARHLRGVLAPGADRAGRGRARFWCCWGFRRFRCCPSTGWARRCCCWPSRCSCWKPSSPRTASWERAARWPWCWAR